MYDFSLRSLARLPIGRARAVDALIAALKTAEAAVEMGSNSRLPAGFSMHGLVFAIAKFAVDDHNRSALIQAGVFPTLVAAAGIANDSKYINLCCNAVKALSCDEISRIPFIRSIFHRVLAMTRATPVFPQACAQRKQLNHMLQDLFQHFEEASALASGAQLDVPVLNSFLGRLLAALNLHLQIRSDLLDFIKGCKEGETAISAAVGSNAAVGSCIHFLGLLLSKHDTHESNVTEGMLSAFEQLHGDTYEPWKSSSFLDCVSRLVIAVKLPDSAWDVSVDCKMQPEPHQPLSSRSFRYARKNRISDDDGSSALIAPLQQHAAAAVVTAAARSCDFNLALCSMCQESLFQLKSDGSIFVIARQLKCFESTHDLDGGRGCKCAPFPPSASAPVLQYIYCSQQVPSRIARRLRRALFHSAQRFTVPDL
jgi:hypothetical protein